MKDTHKKIKKAWILLHNDIFIFYHFLNRIFIENCSSSCCKMCSKMRNTCNVCKISLQWSINTFSSLQNNSMLLFPKTHAVCSSEQFCVRHAGSSSSTLHPTLTGLVPTQVVPWQSVRFGQNCSSPREASPSPGPNMGSLPALWAPEGPLSSSLGHTPEPPLLPPLFFHSLQFLSSTISTALSLPEVQNNHRVETQSATSVPP